MSKSCNCKTCGRSMFTKSSQSSSSIPYSEKDSLLSENKIQEVGWFYKSKDFYYLLHATITDHLSFLERNSCSSVKAHFPKHPLHERDKAMTRNPLSSL